MRCVDGRTVQVYIIEIDKSVVDVICAESTLVDAERRDRGGPIHREEDRPGLPVRHVT